MRGRWNSTNSLIDPLLLSLAIHGKDGDRWANLIRVSGNLQVDQLARKGDRIHASPVWIRLQIGGNVVSDSREKARRAGSRNVIGKDADAAIAGNLETARVSHRLPFLFSHKHHDGELAAVLAERVVVKLRLVVVQILRD